MAYVDLVLEYTSSVVDSDGMPFEPKPYILVIKPPTSPHQYPNQLLPERIRLEVLPNTKKFLKLVSCEHFEPKGVYEVSIYEKGIKRVMAKQEWIVPPRPLSFTEIAIADGSDTLPTKNLVVEGIVNQSYPYVVVDGRIKWTDSNNRPGDNEQVSVTYRPYLTLNSVIKKQP